eukprot:sb/3478750/
MCTIHPYFLTKDTVSQLHRTDIMFRRGVSVNRETSYVSAIGSAAIVHQIARDCADGTILACGCGINNEYSTYHTRYLLGNCQANALTTVLAREWVRPML